jgi:hypothetical protein
VHGNSVSSFYLIWLVLSEAFQEKIREKISVCVSQLFYYCNKISKAGNFIKKRSLFSSQFLRFNGIAWALVWL